MRAKKGISLIVLVITIIVIMILAGAVILNLSKNNPIESSKKAKFQSDIDTFKSDLSLYELNQMSKTDGSYDPKLLNSDKSGTSENGEPTNTEIKIADIISSMKNTKYDDKLKVEAGQLVYIGSDINESNWASSQIEVKGFSFDIALTPSDTAISGTLTLSGVLVDTSKIDYYKIYLGTASGDKSGTPLVITEQNANVSFDITSGVEPYKTYYVIVELKMKNENDVRIKELKVVSSTDIVAPNAPQIATPDYSKELTIAPIAVTLSDNDGGSGISKTNSKYVVDQISTNYTEDDTIWNSATSFTEDSFTGNTATISKEVPADGEYYVHTLAVDNMGNKKSATSSKVLVDTIVPNEPSITIPNTASTNTVQAIVTMSDNTNGSGLDLANCKYIYSTVSNPYGDTEEIWNTATAFTSEAQTITVTSNTNEIYYLHVLLVDKAGNRREILSGGVTTNTDVPVAPVVTGTVATNTWTNQNVTLTVNTVTSPNIIRYEYSINSGSWQTYNSTDKIIITGEGTTYVKARAVNNVGTIGAESTGYVVNIDRTNPTVTFGTNGGQNATQVSTIVNVTDAGSNVNTSTLQYVWDTQNSTTPSSGWATFTNGATLTKTGAGSYYVWIKGSDNAGNVVTNKSNKFIVGDLFDIVSEIRTYNATFDGSTSGYSYNNPVIPAGFMAADTDDAKWTNLGIDWNNGLVIVDSYGNQFVWVPVDGNNVTYAKWCTTGTSYASTTDDTLPTNFSVSNITTAYKGFYIGRYQASNNGDKVAIKKAAVWNYINYTNSKLKAESMAANYAYDTTKIGTNLVTGAQWDTVMKWIQNSGKNVTDSRTWGNYTNSISPANVSGYKNIQVSGYSNYWKAKNIYDLAGNVWEWTSEKISSNYTLRGGGFNTDGTVGPASGRTPQTVSWTNLNVGFRVALYIK